MCIEFDKIKKSFGDRLLFKSQHVTVSQGRRIGIVGDNGSGKSTLLNCIQDPTHLDDGVIRYSGIVLGISQELNHEFVNSGGEQTKEKIRKAFAANSQILLADEPTNHLDQKGQTYFIQRCKEYVGTIFIVSHDRFLLDHLVDGILEIDQSRLKLYEGTYTQYEEQKRAEKEFEKKTYLENEKKRRYLLTAQQQLKIRSAGIKKAPNRMGNSEARLHKRGKQQQAQKSLNKQKKSAETRIKKLEKIAKPYEASEVAIPIKKGRKIYQSILLHTDDLSVKFGTKQLVEHGNFSLKTGSKTALLGDNGSGKSSLLQMIASRNPQINFVKHITIGYLSQTIEELNPKLRIKDLVEELKAAEQLDFRIVLAHFLLEGHTLEKRIQALSGGEKSLVALALLLVKPVNLLLLDEPTNHLDIKRKKALESALGQYSGTILFVSHDQRFIQQVASDRWWIKKRKILREQEKNQRYDEENNQQHILLENRKALLISQLSFVTSPEEKKD